MSDEPTAPYVNDGIGDEAQTEVAARLQSLWLHHMETLLQNGTISSTDLATLARVLLANGWSLDPKRLPSGLADKLTQKVKFDGEDHNPLRMVK